MEDREDLKSILPFLPLLIRSSSLYWPARVVEALKAMSEGPSRSRVDSGEVLWLAISDMRQSLSFSSRFVAPSASHGYALFFDELLPRKESNKWLNEIIPKLAKLLLQFTSLLEMHYQNAGKLFGGIETGLRLLGSEQTGIVFLSQELIGCLLACSLFCLFPDANRDAENLPGINFDHLFASLYENYSENQESKIRCIMCYFERVFSCMPTGFVSFERKVIPAEYCYSSATSPEADFWSKSALPLCAFKVHTSGLIEDQPDDALEVDFANKYLGGGALSRGCVQEEIRFMINPELIAGMFFLTCMDDNEAIEIVGAERFSCYTGKPMDPFGRRRTRIVAIDALYGPKMRHFKHGCLLRESNKALCGFLHGCKYSQFQSFKENGSQEMQLARNDNDPDCLCMETSSSHETPSVYVETSKEKLANKIGRDSHVEGHQCMDHEDTIGIATGNWGCGAFGGDPELKAMIQWLAASQARRPYISYYTFGVEALRKLDQVTEWILSHEWAVGDLWNMMLEYTTQRLNRETDLGFFSWLLPWLTTTVTPPHHLNPQIRLDQ
ncbi:PREDICTED: poly(ADP-ribose) glycohydrolase 1 isoform X2 [Tarenaya hassleriana]|uniref:poly(ADP-ribose) glycohydrolase 1 isoform X2 n=1 Tax=Tarenaya hassleriana TaxID=28532 RepID=UPI00053CA4FA|nr:PREDICTED: poly(ADP-ribose) glycohydrolase 1 isoform X2 [Tarenaya hassleriana]